MRLTGRHLVVTEAIEDYFRHRLATLHVDFPALLEIHGLLGIEKYRQRVDIVIRCNRHITIKASSENDDMYASIGQAVHRTARMMRKYHNRLTSGGLARRKSVRRV